MFLSLHPKLRGCLFVVAVLAVGGTVLTALLYIEEDWRGAHDLAAAEEQCKHDGASLNYASYAPPSVPDDQNLAAQPLFLVELKDSTAIDGSPMKSAELPNLKQALHEEIPRVELPSLGNWMHGDDPNQTKIQDALAADYYRVYPLRTPPGDSFALFNALYPFVGGLRDEAARRSGFRYQMKDDLTQLMFRPLGPLVSDIKIAKALALNAVLSLDHGRSDLALADMRAGSIIISSAAQDPSLIGGLVALGCAAIDEAAVFYGLKRHQWTDAQLFELEKMLQPDFLADSQHCMRAECAKDIPLMTRVAESSRARGAIVQFVDSPLAAVLVYPGPPGWWEENAAQLISFHRKQIFAVDPVQRVVYPRMIVQLSASLPPEESLQNAEPWSIWFLIAARGTIGAMARFAEGQVWADEARIACALERYRLAHGAYPAALDALMPACIDALPHDVMSGQPYHYALKSDGAFLLYSVGWNQTDDGGKEVDEPGTMHRDYKQGDWVWPSPRA